MNSVRPRLIRMAASAVALSMISIGCIGGIAHAATSGTPASTPTAMTVQAATAPSPTTDAYTAQVLNLMNQKRAAAGLAPVKWNQQIGNVSQDWANHLGVATTDPNFDFSKIHRSDAGGSLIPAGAKWWGEIIACNYSAQAIVEAWMNSPSHKVIMLDPKATDIGIGYAIPASGPYVGCHEVVANLAAYPNQTPALPFNDLAGNIFVKEITWMKTQGISTGYADGSYRPYANVNREQMAAFMYRMAGSPAYTPPAVSPFVDVPATHYFYKEIAWMKASGVSTGWSDGKFRPNEPVLRESMAAFMQRYSAQVCSVDVPATKSFTDTNSSIFASQISWMGGTGVSTGYADGTYRPYDTVTREAMAAFMYRLNNHINSNGGCS